MNFVTQKKLVKIKESLLLAL